MGFTIKKKLDLAPFGWDGCELVFQSLSYEELQDLQKKYAKADATDPATANGVLDFIRGKFISGTVLDENDKQAEIEADDLGKLPFEIIEAVTALLTGNNPDPKG